MVTAFNVQPLKKGCTNGLLLLKLTVVMDFLHACVENNFHLFTDLHVSRFVAYARLLASVDVTAA